MNSSPQSILGKPDVSRIWIRIFSLFLPVILDFKKSHIYIFQLKIHRYMLYKDDQCTIRQKFKDNLKLYTIIKIKIKSNLILSIAFY